VWITITLEVVALPFRTRADSSTLRWTVDLEEDLEFVRQVYTKLYSHSELFTSEDIVGSRLKK